MRHGQFILLKQYDRLLHLFLVCFLLLVALSIPGCGAHTENGGSGDKTDISSTPTNTPAPDTNYLSVRVNGSLYGGAKPATSNEVNEDNYLGEVTSSISPSLLPKNDFESNCFKVGTKIYGNGKDDKTVIVAAKENEGYSYYICKKT